MNTLWIAPSAVIIRYLALGILFIGQVSGLSAIPIPSFWKQPEAQNPVHETPAFRFSPRAGQTFIYRLDSRMDSEGQNFLGNSLTLNVLAGGEIDAYIRQVSKDKVFAELSSPGIRIFLRTLSRQDEFTLKNSPDSPVQMVFDRTSRIQEIKNTEALEEQNPMNFSVLEVLRSYWPALPDRPVSVGESWPDHKKLEIPFQGMTLSVELEITFTLDAVVPAPEGQLALISAAYAATISGECAFEDFKGSFEGNGSGSGNLHFQVESGYFTEYRLDYVINGTMVIRKAETKFVEWPFKLAAGASLILLEWR
jgi:hypothetical protein